MRTKTTAKPVVGISVCIDRGKRLRSGADYYYVRRDYAARIREAGGIPLLLTLDTSPRDAVRLCQGLIVTGGDNLPRSLTTAEVASSDPEDRERIAWDRELLDRAAEQQAPLLGVCYGMQLINLHYGGSLYEDLSTEHPGASDHGGAGHVRHHDLVLVRASALWHGLPRQLTVNSSHRQAVASLAPGFSVTARADDGVIEAFEGRGLYGVEWHPETDQETSPVFENFVRLVAGA